MKQVCSLPFISITFAKAEACSPISGILLKKFKDFDGNHVDIIKRICVRFFTLLENRQFKRLIFSKYLTLHIFSPFTSK